jgi:hypothetical protein
MRSATLLSIEFDDAKCRLPIILILIFAEHWIKRPQELERLVDDTGARLY